MPTQRLEHIFFVGLLVCALAFFVFLLLPNLSALVLSATLALVFHPLYARLVRVFHHRSAAALAVVGIVVVVVFIPLAIFGWNSFNESTRIYTALSERGSVDVATIVRHFPHIDPNGPLFVSIVETINSIATQALDWMLEHLGTFFTGLAQALSTAIIALLGLFYFLKDSSRLRAWTISVVPLEQPYSEQIIHEVRAVMSSVIRGTIVVAMIQGLVAGVGFAFFGVPEPAFWGSLVILASPIPLVGAWLVITPMVAYLIISGAVLPGIGLLLWSIVFVNVLYNVVAPELMHRGNTIHPFVILLAMLGGIMCFGPIGFLLGPFVAAFVFALLELYPRILVKNEL